jgi:hypothetical protein
MMPDRRFRGLLKHSFSNSSMRRARKRAAAGAGESATHEGEGATDDKRSTFIRAYTSTMNLLHGNKTTKGRVVRHALRWQPCVAAASGSGISDTH